jgi:Endosomal/lysosomal potassium channel TMEM175
MEGFSDGVFGVAITLLVVDLAVHPPGTALQQVLHAWPSYVAYIISFLTTGTAWLGHTALTDRLARTDPVFLRLNLLLLLVVVFLPFPTRLVAEALHDPLASGRCIWHRGVRDCAVPGGGTAGVPEFIAPARSARLAANGCSHPPRVTTGQAAD